MKVDDKIELQTGAKENCYYRILLSSRENQYYNIARVLALYKPYWAAMNKIFIYARVCVNKITWAMQCSQPTWVFCSAITVRQNNSVVVAQEKTASFLQSVFSNCTVHGSVNIILTIKTLDDFGSLTFKTFLVTLDTFLCVERIFHSITIKGFFAQILVVALL